MSPFGLGRRRLWATVIREIQKKILTDTKFLANTSVSLLGNFRAKFIHQIFTC
ncbi:MAG: hypothetical protein JWN45_2114 [Acidobacteriaceae bacterium]|nr:hypothetical protein [Acidobacteriaceae bacterium]